MCLTVTALNSQVALIPREIMHYGRSMSRLYHYRKFYCANSLLLGKYLSPFFTIDTWRLSGTCRSSLSTASSSTTTTTTQGFSGNITKVQAKKFISNLTSQERDIFLKAIHECKSEEDKTQYEGQLAGVRWRGRFGRPAKFPSLGDVDPTGTYCHVPEDWLIRKYVENIPEPTTKELILVAISNAIPFIGFGFLDNCIMIVAGDQIEMLLSRKFPVSTMAAAALGNTVSDVIGIGSVHYVERLAQKVGFKPPILSPIQLNMPKMRVAANVGRVIGVTIGCILGMVPINFLHNSS